MARIYPHVITFRVTDEELRKMHSLTASLEGGGWGQLFRRLLALPEVDALIDEPEPALSGIERSVPVGDR